MLQSDLVPDVFTYSAAIGACEKCERWQQANDTGQAEFWLSKMLESGVTPSVGSYATVLQAHAQEGNIEAAKKGLERMRKKGVEANVFSYSALTHACAQTGETDRAELWFN
jgi:pentatricopeptide repeat protein